MLRRLLNGMNLRRFTAGPPKEVIGIDFGTAYASVAITEGDQTKIVENNEGFRSTPSVVAFNKEGQRLVGSAAKRQALTNPQSTYTAIRQLLGKKVADPELQEIIKSVAFKIVPGDDNKAFVVDHNSNKISPVTIAGHLFSKIREGAEGSLNMTLTDAVVAVPAHYQEPQRQAILEAAKLAGFKTIRVLDEPIAACLAYNVEKTEGKKIFVYDLGGDLFDGAVVVVEGGKFVTKALTYDTDLAGDNIDMILKRHFMDEFKKQSQIDLKNDPMARQRVLEAAEKAKIELSTLVQSDVNLPYITADASGPHHFSYILKRSKMESLIDDLLKKTFKRCDECLKSAKIEKADIDEVLLAGGVTKMPIVRTLVEEYFGKPTNKNANPDEAIAVGAAIQGHHTKDSVDNIVLLDIVPLSIGIESVGGLFTRIVDKGSIVPLSRKFVVSTGSDDQPSIGLSFYIGERPQAKDNQLLGQFLIQNLFPAEKGKTQVEVTMQINEQGLMKVQTRDLLSGNEQSFSAPAHLHYTPNEIENILSVANRKKKEDEAFVKELEAKLELDDLVMQVQRSLNLVKDFEPSESESVKDALNRATQSMNKGEQEDYPHHKSALGGFLGKIKEKLGTSDQTEAEPTKDKK